MTQQLVRDQIQISAAFSAMLNVTLKVGAISETLTVSGESPVVDTTSTTPRIGLSAKMLSEVIAQVAGRQKANIPETNAPGEGERFEVIGVGAVRNEDGRQAWTATGSTGTGTDAPDRGQAA